MRFGPLPKVHTGLRIELIGRLGMTPSNDLVAHFLRLKPEDISYVKYIFESYEGIGFLRTMDKATAVIVVLVAPDFAEEAEKILSSIEGEIEIERVPGPSRLGDDWIEAAVWGEG